MFCLNKLASFSQLFCLLGMFCFFQSALSAQERPKVGLVLSGGGAKGAAHVGVLKVIEESGIKIDYITGTSMGSIVGGLYASGWSASQLDSIIKANDLRALMQDDIPRRIQPFFEKEYGEKYAVSLSMKDLKLNLPSAISNGQDLFDYLTKLTEHTAYAEKFDELPIPFATIGTDIETGKMVVLEEGNLAAAMRASASFPGLLSPWWIGNQLMVDGGIVNNFPAKLLKDKGMDIVIGVNVGGGLYSLDELTSVTKVIEQITYYQMAHNVDKQIPYCDFIIFPDIENFGVTSFEAVGKLIENGETAARPFKERLEKIAAGQKEKEVRKDLIRPKRDSIYLANWVLGKKSNLSRESILAYFPQGLEGLIDTKEFKKSLLNLFGNDRVAYVDYHFQEKENGQFELYLEPVPNKEFDSKLRAAFRYDKVNRGVTLLNYTALDFLGKNSTLSTNVVLGERVGYSINYLLKLNNFPDIGFNSVLDNNSFPINFASDTTRNPTNTVEIRFDYNDFSNEIYLRFLSNNYWTAGISAEYKIFSTKARNLNDARGGSFVGEEGKYFTGSLYTRYDSRNTRYFPTSGLFANLRLRGIHPFSSTLMNELDNSLNTDFSFTKIIPFSKKFSLGLSGDIGFNFGAVAPPYVYILGSQDPTLLNNIRPFDGLAFGEKFGTNIVMGKIYGLYNVVKNQFLTIGANVAFLEDQDDFAQLFKDESVYSISAGYGLNTAIGPINVTYAHSNLGGELYINIGYWF